MAIRSADATVATGERFLWGEKGRRVEALYSLDCERAFILFNSRLFQEVATGIAF